MADKKEKKHAAAEEASETASKKRSTTGYIVGAVIVLAVILFLVFGRSGEVPSPDKQDVAPEAPAAAPSAPEAVPEEPSAAPADAGSKGAETAPAAPAMPSAVSIVSEETQTGSEFQGNKEITPVSWFSGVSCQFNVGDGPYNDKLTFTVTNKGEKTYYLGYVRLSELDEKTPLRVSVNGHGLRETAQDECSAVYLKPGESTTCTANADLRRTVVQQETNEVGNKLIADAAQTTSMMAFTC
ncbi:hypothetical protein HYU19_04275 [Candidatus Woesearchaeota archaeon]|nr:hypothetical protein [Candidatus Woesearchaeota archaeon]